VSAVRQGLPVRVEQNATYDGEDLGFGASNSAVVIIDFIDFDISG
jgi:hypothetical protein